MPQREDGHVESAAAATAPARIAANILAADLACLGHEVAVAIRSGAERVHVDVMEFGAAGVSVGPLVCRALKRVTRAPLDVHLLVNPSQRLVAAFADAGADVVVFHAEASEDVLRTLAAVRGHGCGVGLALAAGTPLDVLGGFLRYLDVVLVTGVATAEGDRPAPSTLRWVRALRDRASAQRAGIALAAEGGIDAANGPALAAAGVDVLVVESARCRSNDRAANIAALAGALQGGPPSAAGARCRGAELPS